MADVPPRSIRVSPAEFEALNAAKLDELQKKHGLDIEIRSTASGISDILKTLGREENLAGHERGFDRTDPGYSRSYDREIATLKALDEAIVSPVETPPDVRGGGQ